MNSDPRPGPSLWTSDGPAVHRHQPLDQGQADAEARRRSGRARCRPARRGRRRAAGGRGRSPCHRRGRGSPHRAPRGPRSSSICPPGSVNSAALLSRFTRTWSSRTGSASSQIGRRCGDHGELVAPLLASAAERSRRPARPGPPGRSAPSRSRTLPCVRRVTSSRSSMSRAMCRTCRSTMLPASRTSDGSSGAWRRTWTELSTGASGLRSSWESMARNSSLRRLASASSSAWRRSSISSCLRSVVSRITLANPLSSPRSSRSAVDHRASPEPRPVAPDLPFLAGHLAARRRPGGPPPRHWPRLDVLGDREPREGLADHFGGVVPEEEGRAVVPAQHAPLRVEQQDRVVLDAIEEDLDSLLIDRRRLLPRDLVDHGQ